MRRFGILPSLLFAVSTFVATHAAPAATKEPPYEAVVESDDAFARCGPGKNFYPTAKLKRGDHVTVRRHDPGGWFMIDPPPGSFSLIQNEDVEREGNVGTIKSLADGQTPVRIGSAIDPTINSVYQRQLSSGERVEIFGEVTVPRRGIQVQMLKVRPPKGEFRWIDGMNLTPVDQQLQDQQIRDRHARVPAGTEPAESDPFSAAPPAKTNSAKANPTRTNTLKTGKLAKGMPAVSVKSLNTPPASRQPIAGTATANPVGPGAVAIPVADPRGRLEQIDREFRDTVQRHPSTWNLTAIEQAYRELSQQTDSPAIRGQLELRMTSLDHYKRVKGDYDDYFRLVSSTARKDAELAAIQNSLDPRDARPPIASPGPGGVAMEPAPSGTPNMAAAPGPQMGPGSQMPTMSVPTQQAPTGPALNLAPQAPSNAPQSEQRPAGPVLENPVPLPTEPDQETRPGNALRGEKPITSQPAVPTTPAPGEGSNQEMPSRPITQSPQPNSPGGSFQGTPNGNLAGTPETDHRTAPQNDDFQPQAPATSAPSRSPIATPQQTYPPVSVQPGYPAMQQTPMQRAPMQQMPMQQMPANSATPVLAAPRQIRPQAGGGLDGAGIIQRAATPVPGGPRHVLLAPNGRILAYLYPDRGVNLDAYIGRPMGVVGSRAYRSELRTDLIVVRGMVPVHLAP